MRDECYDPNAISENLLDEVIRGCAGPGGLRPIFDVYRNTFENSDFVEKKMQRKLTMPVGNRKCLFHGWGKFIVKPNFSQKA
jgi:hypothetical protein